MTEDGGRRSRRHTMVDNTKMEKELRTVRAHLSVQRDWARELRGNLLDSIMPGGVSDLFRAQSMESAKRTGTAGRRVSSAFMALQGDTPLGKTNTNVNGIEEEGQKGNRGARSLNREFERSIVRNADDDMRSTEPEVTPAHHFCPKSRLEKWDSEKRRGQGEKRRRARQSSFGSTTSGPSSLSDVDISKLETKIPPPKWRTRPSLQGRSLLHDAYGRLR